MASLVTSLFPALLLAAVVAGAAGMARRTAPARSEDQPEFCQEPPPGVRKMMRGVDIASLDVLPFEIVGENGFKSPVIKMECNEPRFWSLGETKFQMPDQVWTMTSTPGGLLSTDTVLYKSSLDVRRSMQSAVGVTNRYCPYAFSTSSSYIRMQQYITSQNKFITDTQAVDAVSRVDLLPSWALELDGFAKAFLRNTIGSKRYAIQPQVYHDFIKQFGTHYFSVARFGGSIRVLQQTSTTYLTSHTDVDARRSAKRSFLGVVNSYGVQESSTSVVDSDFASKTSHMVKYYGGTSNLLTSGGIQAWQPTVESDPWLIAGQLRPISDLIRDDVQRKGMERATNQHLLQHYLVELRRQLLALRGNLGARYDSLLTRLKNLEAAALGGIDETLVVNLQGEIEAA